MAGATRGGHAHNTVHLYMICEAEAACSSDSESIKTKPQLLLALSGKLIPSSASWALRLNLFRKYFANEDGNTGGPRKRRMSEVLRSV